MSSLNDLYDDESESERDFRRKDDDDDDDEEEEEVTVEDEDEEADASNASNSNLELQEETESEENNNRAEDRSEEDEEDEEGSEKSGSERSGGDKSDSEKESGSERQSESEKEKSESEPEDQDRDFSQEDKYGEEGEGSYDDDENRGFGGVNEVYGDDPEQFDDEGAYMEDQKDRGQVDPEQPAVQRGSGGMTRAQSVCLVFCCCICIILALIAGAVLGVILLDDDKSMLQVLGVEDDEDDNECRSGGGGGDGGGSVIDNPPEPFSQFKCPEDNVPLEFRITFDARPGEVGLRVFDTFGINMWNFPARSFGSFALLLRENIFTLCLSPFQNYTLELSDTAENGLISTFGAEIFGSFSLLYADQPVTSYNGDCNTTTTVTECGEYCKCTYLLAVNASKGACTTICDE